MNPAGLSNAVAGQSSITLDERMYDIEPTKYCRRDAGFHTRKIVGGFEGKPAVVKQPKPTGNLTDELILKEIDFLDRVSASKCIEIVIDGTRFSVQLALT